MSAIGTAHVFVMSLPTIGGGGMMFSGSVSIPVCVSPFLSTLEA